MKNTKKKTNGGNDGETVITREVPVAWEALEDAFENNAHEVHSYLHLETGEVIRIVDGVADPSMHSRIMSDPSYLRIDPVSSREQYRWMERFIATVDDPEFRHKLLASIDGKGAFRRFKDVLMSYPVDRERWFTFRSERLRFCMEAWLRAHGIKPVERPQWRVPTAQEVKAQLETTEQEPPAKKGRSKMVEIQRRRMHELIDLLPVRELDTGLAFLEFLRERRPMPRPQAKSPERSTSDDSKPGSREEGADSSSEKSGAKAEDAKDESARREANR